MLWNDLNYDLQLKVYDCIEKLLLKEKDESIQGALILAMKELEAWDNSPCSVIDRVEDQIYVIDNSWDVIPVKRFDKIIKQTNCDCKFPWLCRCLYQEKAL